MPQCSPVRATDTPLPGLLVVLVATEAEAAPWRCILRSPAEPGDISVIVTGVGRDGDAIVQRAARRRPGLLLGFGFAGALNGTTPPGTLVALDGSALIAGPAHITTAHAPPATLVRALRAAGLQPGSGTCLTLDAPLHDARLRDELRRRTGAVAVDMENALRQQAAEALGVPFAALCVICDRADLPLPELRHRLIDADGSIRWGRWLAALRQHRRLGDCTDERRLLLQARADWLRATATLGRATLAIARWWSRRTA